MNSRALALRQAFIGPAALRGLLRWTVGLLIGFGGFGLFVALVGNSPIHALSEMWRAAFGSQLGLAEVAVAAAPTILCALAVAVPAKAGLWNLGGQGQFVFGVMGATLVSQWLDAGTPPWIAVPMIGLGGALAGALWAGVPAVLRVAVGLNEAISSLLLGYVAIRVLQYAVHGPWKDAASLGFPQARPFPDSHRLPGLGVGRLHAGVIVAVVAAIAVGLLISRTRWGFDLRVVGGNNEAARRAGLPVKRLIATSMMVGGGLAGVAGMVQLAGAEFQARPEIAGLYGFLGFLVSWLSGHSPGWIVVAGLAIGAITVGGDGLQIGAGLPGASVNILMALLLLSVLGRRGRLRGAEG